MEPKQQVQEGRAGLPLSLGALSRGARQVPDPGVAPATVKGGERGWAEGSDRERLVLPRDPQ